MNKNIFTSTLKLSWIFLCLFQLNFVLAQTNSDKMSVLKMYGNSNHFSYLDTNIDLKNMLLDQGTSGQATLEFWAKFPSATQKLVITTDAVQSKNFNLTFQKGQISLSSTLTNTSYTVNPTTLPVASLWQHFAITFTKGQGTDKYNLTLYIDGVRVTTFNGVEIASKGSLYFTKGQVNDEIMLTEIRAWNQSKTEEQIALNRFISYYNYNSTNISAQVANGLVANYSGAATTTQNVSQLSEMSFANWTNTVQKSGYPSYARIATSVKNTKINKTLADINTAYVNPIEELSDIVVNASKGKYNNKVEIQWFHAQKLTYYTIYRDNLKIGTLNNLSNKVGDQLNFIDTEALPGTVYSYTVEGNDTSGSNYKSGKSSGFIFPNGTLTGLVKTQSDVYVDQVGLEIGLSSPNTGINGSAVSFAKDSKKITIQDRLAFTDNTNITLEFWYKNSTSSATTANTVFKLANTEINMSPTSTTLKWGANTSKTFNLGTADTAWHHYAFALGTNGIEVFKDGISIGSAADAYTWTTTAIDMNAYINYTASYEYALDEFRVWSGKKSQADVAKFRKYVVDSDEKNLLLAYSFDLIGISEIYNHALNTRGDYVGKSEAALSFSTQPSTLKYVAFTDANGNYNFNTIYSKSANGNDYNVVAFKPNHEFRPSNIGVTIKQSTLAVDYSKVANFTDISELPVAGNILYKVNGVSYPVPSGKKIAIDGKPLVGIGTALESNIDGVYSVSSSLGKHTIEVFNPELTENKTLNSIQFSPTFESGKAVSKGYANTKKTINYSNNGITFSGYVRPFTAVELPNYQPEKQTLLDWGQFEIALANNTKIQLWYNGSLQSESTITNPSDFNFFAVSIAPSGDFGIVTGDDYKTGILSSPAFSNEILYVGASVDATGVITKNCVSNISNIQIRNKNYTEINLRAIKNGDIIANDAAALELIYEMDQEKGTRLVSKTNVGFDNYLTLQESAKIDTTLKSNYTKKYMYSYLADNPAYNPATGSASYDLNVVDPLTAVNFQMTTRYGFVGNIVVPCDNSIGVLTGTIKRTDVTSNPLIKNIGAENFDIDNKIFKVDDLVPGHYQVSLSNADGTIKLVSPIIDLTKGWKTYDFEYRSPLLVDVNAYVVKEAKITTPIKDLKIEDFEALQKACSPQTGTNDFYVLKEGNSVLFQAVAYEKYGDQKCYVANANITFAGDLLTMPDGNTTVTGTTDVQGRSIFMTYVDSPNFTYPYLRSLTVQATQDSRSKIVTVKGFVEGAKMNQSDFTIDDPIVDIVVHDPPGDASSATLKKGHKTVTTGKWKSAVGYSCALVNKSGIKVEQDMIATVMGVGTSVGLSATSINTGVDASWKVTGTYNGTTVTETETFTDVTTSSSENLVGKKADLFVGKGYLITVGTGETLAFDTTTCSAVHATETQVLDNRIKNVFVHSYYDIQKNMIPNFLTAYTQETDTDKRNSYENSIVKWIDILLKNDYALNDYKKSDYDFMKDYAFLLEKYNALPITFDATKYNWSNYSVYTNSFDKNRSFDGGGAITTVSILNNNTITNGADFETALDLGYRTTIKGTISGANSEFEYKNIGNVSTGGGFSVSEGDYELAQFKLSDNDAGDRFAIEVRKDPYFKNASPIFRTLAGKSSCPAEKGTQLRTGVEIVADGATIANGLNTEVLKYNIKLRNTQTADNQDSSKTYKLSVPVASNPYGATVTVNGATANGALFTFGPDPSSPTGIKQEISATVEIKMNANDTRTDAEYKNIQLTFSVPCEEHNDIGYTHNTDVYEASNMKSIDYLYLTAQFHGPCISGLSMSTPQSNWVVNAESQNKQDFAFTIPGTTVKEGVVILPETLTAVDIEYAIKDNNSAKLIRSIKADELKQSYRENAFRISLDVSGLPNGEYGFRLTPVCGIGTESWRKNTPTAYVYGNISREAPKLLATTPVDGGLLQTGSITATYNKALDPTTLSALNVALRGTLGGAPKKLVSVDFKTKGNQITIPHGSFLNLQNAYTLEFWVNPSSYPLTNSTNLLGKGNNYKLSLQPDGKINYQSGTTNFNTAKAIPQYEWTHVAVVYDGAHAMNFYFNGELAHSVTNFNADQNQLVSNTNNLIIAGSETNEGFLGQMDEIRIWNTMRSQAQIMTYKNRQLLGNETGLNAYYTLDNNALFVEGIQEAVRDYTGNTKGSTAQGITWMEGDMAAPLAIEQLVHDIPVTISTDITKSQIIISPLNFQEYYLEGAKLTAVIAPDKIKGVDGNFVAGTSWSFTINKNNVAWSKANLSASQYMGQAVNVDAWIKNNGGSNATFELQSLPEWLKCTNVALNTATSLNAGFEKKLTFATSAYLNKGTYLANIGVITYNEAGEKTGYEYFNLELTVNCQAPSYEFNNANYALMKEFTAQLTIGDELSLDTNDKVVAYYNNEIRGVASVSKFNGKPYVVLDVFYNQGEQGYLTFHVWDDSQCKEYVGLTQSYALDNVDMEGTMNQPVPFITGDLIVRRIPVLNGYQWVTFNVVDTNNSLPITAIKGMTQGDEIMELGTNKKATFDANGIPTGTLTVIDYKKAYQVYATSSKLIMAEGNEAPIKTDINITGSVNAVYTDNYVGYLPKTMFSMTYALRSLSNKFSIGDRVSGREGYAELTDTGWIGTLTHLIPNKAYRIRMANSGILNYSGYINSAKLATQIPSVDADNATEVDTHYLKFAAAKGIEVHDRAHPQTMAVTASIEADLSNMSSEKILVAKVNGEYRGIAKPVIQSGQTRYFMTIYGTENEKVNFELVTDDATYLLEEKLVFNSQSFIGSMQKAYPLHINKTANGANQLLSIDRNPVEETATIGITPSLSDTYQLDIFNIMGAKIATLYRGNITVGANQMVELDKQKYNLPNGSYIVRLTSNSIVETLKVIIK